ncbi:DMT family transporter [Sphingomonas sp. LaA6.9]|uniref:DMT family transporter n=1 Tax=Sphingomonas sp. LaA6.9 TaxID=2919914 RepID=UPI001F4FE81D|nr:DMT family transporter [Sphingomonas sp. LaA6.9]
MMNILWGLNIIAVKMAVEATGPFTAAVLRQAIVFIVCASALRIVPGKMRELIGLGFLSGGIFYIFVNWSLAVSDNISALAIAGQLGVPFSLLLAVVFLGERIHIIRIGGLALSLLGVALLVFDPAAGRELPGMALTACGSFIWALSSLIQRRMSGVPVLTIYAWMGLVGTIVLIPVTLWQEPEALRSLPALPLSDFGWIAFSAIGSTICGHGAMSWLLQRHPITSVVPLTLAAPVISVIVASLFFATPLTPIMIAGGSIALVGVAIVTIRTARVKEHKG